MDPIKRLKVVLSALLIAWNQTHEPEPLKRPDAPEEDQPHNHEEALEPEEPGAFEEQDDGTGIKRLRPRLLVANNTAMLLQCLNHNLGLLTPGNPKTRNHDRDLSIVLTEGFHSSLKNGDRIRLQFENLGLAVHIIVPLEVPFEAYTVEELTRPEQARDRTGINIPKPLPSGAPGYRPGRLRLLADHEGTRPAGEELRRVTPNLAEVAYSHGSAAAVYEVVGCEPIVITGAIKRALLGVHMAFISNTGQDLPSLGATKLVVSFEPNSKFLEDGSSVASAHVFPARNLFVIHSCRQALLFPFVTNQDGCDTRIVISNTSLDMGAGVVRQQGAVKLDFYRSTSDGTPVPQLNSEAIPAGKQLIFNLSSGGNYGLNPIPGFQGYVIARMNFEYGHGMAFIKEPQGAAYSYQAVQIDRGHLSRPREQ